MYFPYLRGKQFELEALLEVNPSVYQNTLPILEPITISRRNLYTRLTNQQVPLILVTNPFYPPANTITTAQIQNVVDTELSTHTSLVLGFIIDQRLDIGQLHAFLTLNPNREKAVIFRHNPFPNDLITIQSLLSVNPADYLIFDEKKTSNRTQAFFNSHPRQVLLTDGFQRKDRNFDYPASSSFDSLYSSWRAGGWFGIGDYLTIGDHYRDGGGPAYVVTLHVTVQTPTGLVVHHFSSTSQPRLGVLPALKFTEANSSLNSSTHISPLASNGLTLFRNWHATQFYPGLGAPKKASMIHHIELMSSIV